MKKRDRIFIVFYVLNIFKNSLGYFNLFSYFCNVMLIKWDYEMKNHTKTNNLNGSTIVNRNENKTKKFTNKDDYKKS